MSQRTGTKGSRHSNSKQEHKNLNRYKFSKEFTDDGDTRFLLTVLNVSMLDAGKYTCKFLQPASDDSIKSASLVVMESVIPKIEDAYLAGSMMVANCSITYQALDTLNEESFPQCSAYVGDELIETNETVSDGYGHIEHVFTMEVYENHTGLDFKCDAHITHSELTFTNSTTMVVMWPVHGVEIAPIYSSYMVGDQINCTALGNPRPVVFRWISCKGQIVYGPVLTVWSFTEYEQQSWTCEALNVINDEPYSAYNTISFISGGGAPTTEDYNSENYTGAYIRYECIFDVCFWASSAHSINLSIMIVLVNIIFWII